MSFFSSAIWWTYAILGLNKEIAFELPPKEKLNVIVYDNGHVAAECKIEPGQEIQRKLDQWLKNNTKNWKATSATYAPSVLVSGQSFSITFIKSGGVINFSAGQYVHKIESSEYQFLNCGKGT